MGKLLHWPDQKSQSQYFYQFFPLIFKLHHLTFMVLTSLNKFVTIIPASSLSNVLFQVFLKSRVGNRVVCFRFFFWGVTPKIRAEKQKMGNKKARKVNRKSELWADPTVGNEASILLEFSEDSWRMHFRIFCLRIRRGRCELLDSLCHWWRIDL